MRTWVKVLGGVTAVSVIAVMLAPGPSPEELERRRREYSAAATARDQRDEDSRLLAEAQWQMKQRLKDPESAQFSGVAVVRVSGKPVVCGEVNARNSFGGFTGRKGFVMPKGGVVIGEEDLPGADWANLWNQSCTDAGRDRAQP